MTAESAGRFPNPWTDPGGALAWLYRDLTRKGYPLAPVLLQIAQRLRTGELAAAPDDRDADCERCGGPVRQPPTGRRRRFCLNCSPQRISRNRQTAA